MGLIQIIPNSKNYYECSNPTILATAIGVTQETTITIALGGTISTKHFLVFIHLTPYIWNERTLKYFSAMLLKALCSKNVSLMENSFTFGVDTVVRIRVEACRFRTKIEGTRIFTIQSPNSSTCRVGCACHFGMQPRGIRTIMNHIIAI